MDKFTGLSLFNEDVINLNISGTGCECVSTYSMLILCLMSSDESLVQRNEIRNLHSEIEIPDHNGTWMTALMKIDSTNNNKNRCKLSYGFLFNVVFFCCCPD